MATEKGLFIAHVNQTRFSCPPCPPPPLPNSLGCSWSVHDLCLQKKLMAIWWNNKLWLWLNIIKKSTWICLLRCSEQVTTYPPKWWLFMVIYPGRKQTIANKNQIQDPKVISDIDIRAMKKTWLVGLGDYTSQQKKGIIYNKPLQESLLINHKGFIIIPYIWFIISPWNIIL